MSKQQGRKGPVVEVRSRRPGRDTSVASKAPKSGVDKASSLASSHPSKDGKSHAKGARKVPPAGDSLTERLAALQAGKTPWFERDQGSLTAVVHLPMDHNAVNNLQQLTEEFEGTPPTEVLVQTLLWGAKWLRKVGGSDWAQKRKLAERHLRKRGPTQGFPWQHIPVQVRREMVAELKQRPFPWLNAHRELATKHGVRAERVSSLVQAVALFGFDDPGVMDIDSDE